MPSTAECYFEAWCWDKNLDGSSGAGERRVLWLRGWVLVLAVNPSSRPRVGAECLRHALLVFFFAMTENELALLTWVNQLSINMDSKAKVTKSVR